MSSLAFPTRLHEQVAELAYAFFSARPGIDTVLVVNSCARGQATPESDLDMAVLATPETAAQEMRELEAAWHAAIATDPIVLQFRSAGQFANVHLDVIAGQYTPAEWDDGGGPDYFEVELGNHIAYAAPLHEIGSYYRELQRQWLPYYADDLRSRRLRMVREACAYDLDHVPMFVNRGLYFQAFDRLYKAYQEFLQALFISRRVYPLAYNKWIRLQVEDWLELPQLYPLLPPILSVHNLESAELCEKAEALRALLGQWVQP